MTHFEAFKQLLLTSLWTKKIQSLDIRGASQLHTVNSDLEKKQILQLLIENRGETEKTFIVSLRIFHHHLGLSCSLLP